jgi:tetratricopeptide (TPR) repeat protein
MPLPVSGSLVGIAAAIVISIGIGGTQSQAAIQSQAPIPVPPGTSGFGDRTPASSPYLDLLARYRAAVAAGDDDAHMKALEALATLPDGHSSDHAIREYQHLAQRVAGDANPGRVGATALATLATEWEKTLPVAAVMHLETGFFLFQKPDDARGIGHLLTARAIVEWQPWTHVMRLRPEIGARHASLRRDIYIGITWTLQTYRMFLALQQHLDRVRDQFPDDVMVRLALGSLEEVRATAGEVSDDKPPDGRMMAVLLAEWRRNLQRTHWERAAEHYRAVLKADPALVEARVRLGRVLRLRGQLKEARQELEAAAASANESAPVPMPAFGPPMVMPYLSELFLAEVIEEEGGAGAAAEALTRYQDIVRRWPSCQSGLLALSRAYEARGEREAALNALQPIAREQGKRWCVDPWWSYELGQGWRFGTFVRNLRARVMGAS